jgi:acyl-CoA reductase-like NAD-dependent aldehyde dehydrogenase
VINYIKIAREQGSSVLTGGKAPTDAALQAGCYIEPTVVTAQPSDRVCQEEVFGPFVSITRFKDEADVIQVANSTMYGLGGGLWTRDLQRAHRMAAAIQSGMVWINTYKRVNPNSPFGGVGQSGYGRDLGLESIQEYTYPKSVWVNVDANVPPFYKRS